MGLSQQIRQQLINTFKTEQSEHVQKINQGLLALEKEPERADRSALLNEIFREAHSLKGAARAVGLTTIESLGHGLEDVLLKVKEGRRDFSANLFDLLYQALDAIELMATRLEAGDSTPPARVLALLVRLEEINGESAGAARQNQGELPPDVGVSDTAAPTSSSVEPEEPLVQAPAPASAGTEEQGSSAVTATTDQPSLVPTSDTENRASPQEVGPHLPSSKLDETIRVSVSKLDTLMAQVSELVGAKIRGEQRLAEVRQLQTAINAWYKDELSFRHNFRRLIYNGPSGDDRPRPESRLSLSESSKLRVRPSDQRSHLTAYMARNQEQLRLLNGQVNLFCRQLTNDTMRLSLIINELQEEIKRARMQPLSTITTTFERMVRDLARQQHKQITLTITGGETELDRRVLEQIKDPLIHLLRNAVDHGLETVTERQQAHKSAQGTIHLSAGQQGSNVTITVSDDGRGLNLLAIRQSALKKGLLSKTEPEKLGDAETAMLIFHSGLSTSQIITDISGRGVGLDVVRQNVEELHGTLAVHSTPGCGTKFTLTLPLTLASSRGLLVQAGGQIFALPVSTVERMLQIDRAAVATVEGKEVFICQGKPTALVWLEDILELPSSARASAELTVVIVAAAEKRLGLVVDDLTGEQEIVIKSLGRPLVKVGGIAGATILGSGQVVLVLHAADLIKLAARIQARPVVLAEPERYSKAPRKTILVVDDSITTRTLEKNILEAAGYTVQLATNGEEALSLLATEERPQVIVTDVNMPKLDGFELTRRVKQDDRFINIPVILVTSLDTAADKARGIEVGADAYIVKGRFDQGNLLETIEQLA